MGLVAALFPARLHGHWSILTPVLIAVGVLAIRRLWSLHPAPTLCAAIALSVFSGAWHQIGLGGLPLDRILLVLVIMQFVLRAPGVARAPRLRPRNVHLLMLVAIGYVVGSAAHAGTLTTEAGFLSLVDQFGAVPFVMYLLAPAVFAGERERDMLLATLVGLGAYLGLTAIFETLGPRSLVFPGYIAHVDTIAGGEARAAGPFQAVIAEGFATYACSVAAVIAFSRWRARVPRVLAGVVAIISLAGCVLTLERAVWIGALVASLLAAACSRAGRRRLVPIAVSCAVVAGGALAASPSLAHEVSSRTADQSTVWDRQNQIAAGLRMLAARPLLGFGWDRYERDDLPYFRESPYYPIDGYSLSNYESIGQLLPLHESYLSYAVELGLLGAFLWAAVLLWGVGSSILRPGPATLLPWKRGLLAIATCFLVIAAFNPYQAAFPVLLLWIWAGVAFGGVVPAVSHERSPVPEAGGPCPAS